MFKHEMKSYVSSCEIWTVSPARSSVERTFLIYLKLLKKKWKVFIWSTEMSRKPSPWWSCHCSLHWKLFYLFGATGDATMWNPRIYFIRGLCVQFRYQKELHVERKAAFIWWECSNATTSCQNHLTRASCRSVKVTKRRANLQQIRIYIHSSTDKFHNFLPVNNLPIIDKVPRKV